MNKTEKLYNVAAEESVIGSLLMDATALDKCPLKPGDFFVGYLATIYAAILRLIDSKKEADLFTVADALQNDKTPDKARDWLQILAKLQHDTPSAANIGAYAEIVAAFAQRRQLLQAGMDISEKARVEIDPSKSLSDAQGCLEAIAARKASTDEPIILRDSLSMTIDDIDKRFNAGAEIIGLPSGLADVDRHLSGLWPGSLYIVAGRPGMGKSIFGVGAATHCAAVENKAALVFSLEMPHAQISRRILSARGRLPLPRLINGQLLDEDWPRLSAAVSATMEAPLYIQDRSTLHIRELMAQSRRLHRRTPLALVVVDYLQLLDADGDNRVAEITKISRALKALAMELNIPVLAMAQLNRDVEKRPNKRPLMSDLRDCGSIEQDADVVCFLYRDEIYNPDSQYKGTCEFLVRKFRDGETGMIPLATQFEFARFADFADTWVSQNERKTERGFV